MNSGTAPTTAASIRAQRIADMGFPISTEDPATDLGIPTSTGSRPLPRRVRGEAGRPAMFLDPAIKSRCYIDEHGKARLGVSAMFGGKAFLANAPLIGLEEERTADAGTIADVLEALAAFIRKGGT